MSEAIAYT